MDTAQAFEDELKRAEATAAHEVVVDLSGLDFIAADGLKVLIQANARSRGGGKQLVLVRGPQQVQATFEMTGLLSQLPFVDYGELRSLLHSHRPPIPLAA
jgi:anti-anti-sigma factor